MKKTSGICGAAHLSQEGVRGVTKLKAGDYFSIMAPGKSKEQKKRLKQLTVSFARPVPTGGTDRLLISQLVAFIRDGVPSGGREDDKLVFQFDESLVLVDLLTVATGFDLVAHPMPRALTHVYELRESVCGPFTALTAGDIVSVWDSGTLTMRLPRSLETPEEGHDIHFPLDFEDIGLALDFLAATTGLLLVPTSDGENGEKRFECQERKPD